MDFEKRVHNLLYIADALQFKIEDIKLLFSNIEAELTAESAKKIGMGETYNLYLNYQQIALDVEKELAALHDYTQCKIHWRRIAIENGNGQNIGAVYICPHCDSKSPDDFLYCPHCGRIVGRGYEK